MKLSIVICLMLAAMAWGCDEGDEAPDDCGEMIVDCVDQWWEEVTTQGYCYDGAAQMLLCNCLYLLPGECGGTNYFTETCWTYEDN